MLSPSASSAEVVSASATALLRTLSKVEANTTAETGADAGEAGLIAAFRSEGGASCGSAGGARARSGASSFGNEIGAAPAADDDEPPPGGASGCGAATRTVWVTTAPPAAPGAAAAPRPAAGPSAAAAAAPLPAPAPAAPQPKPSPAPAPQRPAAPLRGPAKLLALCPTVPPAMQREVWCLSDYQVLEKLYTGYASKGGRRAAWGPRRARRGGQRAGRAGAWAEARPA
jgi:hypothetical protein